MRKGPDELVVPQPDVEKGDVDVTRPDEHERFVHVRGRSYYFVPGLLDEGSHLKSYEPLVFRDQYAHGLEQNWLRRNTCRKRPN